MATHSATPQRDEEQNLAHTGMREDTQARELLAALVGFILPVAASANPSPANVQSTRDAPAITAANEKEGEKLLLALQEFISATVGEGATEKAAVLTDVEDSPDDQHRSAIGSTESREDIIDHGILDPLLGDTPEPEEDPNHRTIFEMREMIPEAVRNYVFNKMPIRLLAFGGTGAEPELIDRGEVLRRVLDDAFASVGRFAPVWPQASSSSTDDEYEASQKRNAVISDLVADSARYAILSHTWMREVPGDVVFQDWARRAANERGYRKIAKFCEVAARDHGVQFGWMDTVCIDKTSSSELDESIRSMYKWYRNAHVCVAYLSQTELFERIPADSWFTRGWTLQELLAPRKIRFYDAHWQDFLRVPRADGGFWTSEDVQDMISAATTITPREIELCRRGETDKILVSRKLFLAAERQVTREEDSAYSVMGLLDVDITVAYGEGASRAFFRLIRELLATRKNILDIFNYGHSQSLLETYGRKLRLVPYHPRQYGHRSSAFDIDDASLLDQWAPHEPIVLTHLGIRMAVLLAWSDNWEISQHSTDKRAYTLSSDFIGCTTLRLASPQDKDLSFVSFAILNHGMSMDPIGTVVLPRLCIAVALQTPRDAPGFTRFVPTEKPVVFTLDADNTRIPMAKLRYGLRLETMYL